MKARQPKLLFALLLGLLSLLVITGPAAAEESLDSVLSKYYEAIGGTDAWNKVQNIKQVGTMSMMGMEAPFTVHTAEPKKMRIEFEMQGMKGTQALDVDSGWMVMPFMTGSSNPEALPDEMIDAMGATSGVEGPLFDYKKKGHTIELVGKADVEGTDTYHLKVTLDSGKEMDWYLDAEYYIPIRQSMMVSMQGQEFESISDLSDYKEVGGVMIPHTMTQSSPMGEQVMTSTLVEVNVDIADDFFAMPKAEASDG